MPQVSGSAFLQALGYAIINSLWQFALLWFLFSALLLILKLSARHKYIAAVVVQSAGFVWFVGTFVYYYSLLSQGLPFIQSNIIVEQMFSGNLAHVISRSATVLPYLSIAYLFLITFMGFRWMLSYQKVEALRASGLEKINVEWRLFVQQVAHHLGIKQQVSVHLSKLVSTPLTIGFFKPIILIPLASINSLSKEQMEAVLLHELAHIRRFDYLVNLVIAVIESALYFNPFMHLMSSHIKEEREHSCDDLVLQFQYTPASYAGALLNIALHQKQASPAFALHATDGRKILLHRIKRIIGKKEVSRNNYRRQIFASLFLLLAFVSFFIVPFNQANHTARKDVAAPSLWVAQDNRLSHPFAYFIPSEKILKKEADGGSSFVKEMTADVLTEPSQLGAEDETRVDDEQMFYNTSQVDIDEEKLVSYIPAIDTEDDNSQASPLEQKLLEDITIAVEQAKKAKKPVDVITLKTMMLARVQQMIAQEQVVLQGSVEATQQQLEILKKKIANDIVGNIIVNNRGKIEQSGKNLKIQYTVPEDANGNSYCFEYVIEPSEKEAAKAAAEQAIAEQDELAAMKEKKTSECKKTCTSAKTTKRILKSTRI